jgi:hypothetical protein
MSHYCKLKAMKEFNKAQNLFFSFYVRPLYQDVVGMEFYMAKIIIYILAPTVFLFAFRN